MPHSPYRETVYPPIQDVDDYRRDLHMYQAREDRGERIGDNELLEFAEPLVQHCEFLEAKLDIKKRAHDKLARKNDSLKQEIKALKNESQAQEIEIGALKFELAKTRAAAGSEKQAGPDGDGIQVEVNSQDGEPELGEAEKSKEREDSSREIVGMANPLKRGAKRYAATDGEAVKKGKTV